jgi:hypothetical protein
MLCSFPQTSIHASRFYGRNKLWFDNPAYQTKLDYQTIAYLFYGRIRWIASTPPLSHVIKSGTLSAVTASAYSKLVTPWHAISEIKVSLDTQFFPSLEVGFITHRMQSRRNFMNSTPRLLNAKAHHPQTKMIPCNIRTWLDDCFDIRSMDGLAS